MKISYTNYLRERKNQTFEKIIERKVDRSTSGDLEKGVEIGRQTIKLVQHLIEILYENGTINKNEIREMVDRIEPVDDLGSTKFEIEL